MPACLRSRALKQRYCAGIITDNDRIDHLKRYLSLAALFDPIVASAEVGAAKDSTAIFERALRHLDIVPAKSVFIDDTEANLAALRASGMRVVYFDDAKNDLPALIATLENAFGIRTS
jgi:putative hydrolase of the HAD superfamily